MPKAHLNPAALIAAVAAVGVLLVYTATGNRGFGFETTMSGLALLLVLLAYDEEGERSALQSLAFAAVAGLCAMVAVLYVVILIMQPKSPEQWGAGIWLAATLLFFAVDRMKATSRESSAMTLATPPMRGMPVANVQPSYVSPAAPPAAPVPIQVQQQPVPRPPAPIRQPVVFTEPEVIVPVAQPEPAPYQAPAVPVAIAPIPPGREAMIFLNLLGEGLNVLRSVKAEHLGRDYYRIADLMPENERWEYEPGQVVRCRKKALSNGKHLVAFEEAPRAQ